MEEWCLCGSFAKPVLSSPFKLTARTARTTRAPSADSRCPKRSPSFHWPSINGWVNGQLAQLKWVWCNCATPQINIPMSGQAQEALQVHGDISLELGRLQNRRQDAGFSQGQMWSPLASAMVVHRTSDLKPVVPTLVPQWCVDEESTSKAVISGGTCRIGGTSVDTFLKKKRFSAATDSATNSVLVSKGHQDCSPRWKS